MPSYEALRRKHDSYSGMQARWKRYRDFALDGIETTSQKSRWLPKGVVEWNDQYSHRLSLTHNLGWAPPAVRRMAGSLTKNPSDVNWDEGSVDGLLQDQLQAFRRNFDGAGSNANQWFREYEPKALAMGVQFVEVVRGRAKVETPTQASHEGAPFVCVWQPDELWDWDCDEKGNPLWVKFVRKTKKRASWDADPQEVTIYRVITETEGFLYHEVGGEDGADQAEEVDTWTHNVGMCPIVPLFAEKWGEMRGRSYVDAITLGDWRTLQLESDQSMSSYLHGSPQIKVWTSRALGTASRTLEDGTVISEEALGLGESQALVFPPKGTLDGEEDAEYLQLDVSGMEVREKIIQRTQMQSLNSAGIDPNTITMGEGGGSGGARSGASIAWSFSTAEEPNLNAFADAMDTAEKRIMEIAARYLTPQVVGPEVDVFDAAITRDRKWDMMSADTIIDQAGAADALVPSTTFRTRNALDVAKARLPREPEETWETVAREIEDSLKASDQPPPNEEQSLTEEILASTQQETV